ncbi:MAG: NAD(P)-binding domain-containing protein [Candidatus Limnocylindria bacterium]
MERYETIVVGGGQAGLAASRELQRVGVEHVVLERGRIGQTWRDRWDTFCLVSPNWSVRLPDRPYDGDDPDGFMPRDEIVAYLQGYQAAFGLPVREGVAALSIESAADGFYVHTTAGELRARALVLANGAFQRPHRPPGAETLPGDFLQIDVDDYHNANALPPGRILVVGSGQSGCQIAEELVEEGREVVLGCGRAAWVQRRIGGRDIFRWLVDNGFMGAPVESLPTPAARLLAMPTATGHGGGHDLDLRILRAKGVVLAGHFLGASDHEVRFADDLAASMAWGDDRNRELMGLVRKAAADLGVAVDDIREPEPFDPAAPEQVSLDGFGAVLFAGGFRPDYRAWLPWAEAFDEYGFPIQQDGASTVVDGLYFLGVHFLRKRWSSLLYGVGEDAKIVANAIHER